MKVIIGSLLALVVVAVELVASASLARPIHDITDLKLLQNEAVHKEMHIEGLLITFDTIITVRDDSTYKTHVADIGMWNELPRWFDEGGVDPNTASNMSYNDVLLNGAESDGLLFLNDKHRAMSVEDYMKSQKNGHTNINARVADGVSGGGEDRKSGGDVNSGENGARGAAEHGDGYGHDSNEIYVATTATAVDNGKNAIDNKIENKITRGGGTAKGKTFNPAGGVNSGKRVTKSGKDGVEKNNVKKEVGDGGVKGQSASEAPEVENKQTMTNEVD